MSDTPAQSSHGALHYWTIGLVRDTKDVVWDLYKVMIPIIILVKVLTELNLLQYLAWPLSPVMEIMGLPAATGLVWATAMAVNLYSAIAVLATVGIPLTVAQVTTLATVMLVAHNLPVETRIAQQCGVSARSQLAIRLGCAVLLGFLLHMGFTAFDVFQEPSRMLWDPPTEAPTILAWAVGQAKGLASLFLIILGLIAFVRLLKLLRVTDLFNFLLRPFLKLMGIGREAATITVIGLTLGISYGGGLIIHESRSGNVDRRDLFSAMSLMGLSHALVEDTLLMALIGANMVGTFWARLVFSLLAVALLARLLRRAMPAPQNV
ncbi:MAG: nucleoside recognition domain-containing protein [Oceanidesulfovibrio sp.]